MLNVEERAHDSQPGSRGQHMHIYLEFGLAQLCLNYSIYLKIAASTSYFTL